MKTAYIYDTYLSSIQERRSSEIDQETSKNLLLIQKISCNIQKLSQNEFIILTDKKLIKKIKLLMLSEISDYFIAFPVFSDCNLEQNDISQLCLMNYLCTNLCSSEKTLEKVEKHLVKSFTKYINQQKCSKDEKQYYKYLIEAIVYNENEKISPLLKYLIQKEENKKQHPVFKSFFSTEEWELLENTLAKDRSFVIDLADKILMEKMKNFSNKQSWHSFFNTHKDTIVKIWFINIKS